VSADVQTVVGEPEAPGPLIGTLLDGRYRVLRPLGEGGMGAVYLTHDERLDRKVVVKVPHESQALTSGFRARFRKEIQSLATLDHPHVVKVLDIGETKEGAPYAVMPYLGGGSLKDVLSRLDGPPTLEQLGAWLAPIADALDSIHRRGFVHRDVKPGNLLFDEEGNPYLADFGLVKVLHSGETSLTQSGVVPGSPEYMAPEAVAGQTAGPAYDQYSLGAVAYHALTGSLPITGETAVELLVKKHSEEARPIEETRPDLPAALRGAVMRALHRDPAQRFGSCAEMVTAAGIALPDRSRSVPLLPRPASVPLLPAGRVRLPPWRRPSVRAAALAAALGAAAWALLSRGGSTPAPTLTLLEPVEGQVAFEGERVRLRVRLGDVREGDVVFVDGEPRAGADGYVNALVDMKQGASQVVRVSVRRDGEDVTQAERAVTLEPVPRPEVPEWARVSREQVLEARRIGVPVAFENPLGMRFVLVPGGTFEMGSPPGEPGRQEWERPGRVTLTGARWVQIAPTTNEQLRRWRPQHRSPDVSGEQADAPTQPATGLTHADATAFAAWVGEQDAEHAYRLPTEAEYERSARAGSRGMYWWGDDARWIGRYENVSDRTTLARFPSWKSTVDVDDGFAGTAPVASFPPNPWGLHDLAGNVKQWLADEVAIDPGIPFHAAHAVDPVGRATTGTYLARGNSWNNSEPHAWSRASARGLYRGDGYDPAGSGSPMLHLLGVRLCCPVPAPPHPGVGDEPLVPVVQSPAPSEPALEGQWIRVAVRVEGWREGDVARVNGEPRAMLQGWLHALVNAAKPGSQPVTVAVERGGAEIARETVHVAVEAAPRPEVPAWARISHEQLVEARRWGVPVAFENPLGMRFVLIPSGTFVVGSPAWEPLRQAGERRGMVTFTRPYYAQTTEVTHGQVLRWRADHMPEVVGSGAPTDPQHPATGLTHEVATEFAAWVTEQDPMRRYALLSELQWERAARAGTHSTYAWGDDFRLAGRFANLCDRSTLRRFPTWHGSEEIDDGVPEFAHVGQFEPNPYGLYDMEGNVIEWCLDARQARRAPPEHPSHATDPAPLTEGDARAVRSAAWMTVEGAGATRNASRGHFLPDGTDTDSDRSELHVVGLRLMAPIPATAQPK
jgi:serine/threonine-protein kinase